MGYLAIAIISEVIATTLLPLTKGFTNPLASFGCAAGYASAFYFLSLATASGMSSSTAYAIWCGCGIVLIALVQALLGNSPNTHAVLGILFIIGGVTMINLGGNVSH